MVSLYVLSQWNSAQCSAPGKRRTRTQPNGPASPDMDGLLRGTREEHQADLSPLQHQPPGLLPLAEPLPASPPRRPERPSPSAGPGRIARTPFPVRAMQVDGGPSSRPSSRPSASGAASGSSSYHPAPRSSTATWSGPSGRTPRSYMRSGICLGRFHSSARSSAPGAHLPIRHDRTRPSVTERRASTFESLRTQARDNNVSPMYWTSTRACRGIKARGILARRLGR